MAKGFDVFLSYNRREQPAVLQLAEALRDRGLKVWLDDWVLAPGEPWQKALEAAIQTIPAVAILVGDHGEGPWQAMEMRGFLSEFVRRQARIIPVLLPGAPADIALPPFLNQFNKLDLREGLTPDGLDKLVWGIRGKMPEWRAESVPGPIAREPSYQDDMTRTLGETLERAYRRKEDVTVHGGDTREVEQEILELRRRLREGGRLKAGDFLADGSLRLLEPLGRGGFATVWKAYDRREQTLVAVKVLHGQFAEDRTRLERFFRGARKMGDLHHPNIVRVLERRVDDAGYHFFVMEYVPGGDLRQAILQQRMSPNTALPLLSKVAAALRYAHEQGVVHRDVKPANILLDGSAQPKLTDFDLVRAFDTTGGTVLGGGMMGTFLYTAPEVMDEPGEASPAADVYSLAMTIAFCLFGADLPREVWRDQPSFLRKLPCSAELRAVLEKAIADNPEQRFGSVAELVLALESLDDSPAGGKTVVAARKAMIAKPLSEEPRAEPGTAVWTEPETGIRFLWIPGGRFQMGGDRYSDEQPIHWIRVSPFWLGETPVTNRQYAVFLEKTGHGEPPTWRDRRYSAPDQPVVGVSWQDARSFCRWLSELSGRKVDLPSEAQWEFAARGTDAREYPWGDAEPDETRACFGLDVQKGQPSPVGAHPEGRGPFGTLDQAGNVWEWCLDVWDAEAYSKRVAQGGEPTDPVVAEGDKDARVLRGGGWVRPAEGLRAACRSGSRAGLRDDVIGFRVAAAPASS